MYSFFIPFKYLLFLIPLLFIFGLPWLSVILLIGFLLYLLRKNELADHFSENDFILPCDGKIVRINAHEQNQLIECKIPWWGAWGIIAPFDGVIEEYSYVDKKLKFSIKTDGFGDIFFTLPLSSWRVNLWCRPGDRVRKGAFLGHVIGQAKLTFEINNKFDALISSAQTLHAGDVLFKNNI